MAKEKNLNLKRININIPIELSEQIKDYAFELGINTTSAYIVLLKQALEYKDLMKLLPNMVSLYNLIEKDNHLIDCDAIENFNSRKE